MSIQINRFHTGGFVIHKITGDFKGRMSAWFDADGRVIDAEHVLVLGRPTRPVKQGGPMWQRAAQLGEIHKPTYGV